MKRGATSRCAVLLRNDATCPSLIILLPVIPSASTVDTIDWREERSAQTILDTVLPKLHPGCIILCHNNGFKIKEYLPVLIETAQSQGYEFVTVSELLLEGSTIIDVNGVQKPGA